MPDLVTLVAILQRRQHLLCAHFNKIPFCSVVIRYKTFSTV